MKRPEPIPPNIDVGLRKTVELGADVLLVTDGDADRLGRAMRRHLPQPASGLRAAGLLPARGARPARADCQDPVHYQHAEQAGRHVRRSGLKTGVGFWARCPKMTETDALIGGEESGGYAFRGNVPERDGILAGIYLLDMMVRLNMKPSQLIDLLFQKVGAHYYDRVDRRFTGNREERQQHHQRQTRDHRRPEGNRAGHHRRV